MEPRSFRLPATSGLSLHALEWSTEGTPLVFVHGFSNSARVWDDIAPVVAPHYRTLAIDMRGHGDADRDPECHYDGATMAKDLEAALDSLGIERVVLVGHSMGGRVVMRYAGEHPEKVAGLVVVDTGPEHDARGTLRIRQDVQKTEPFFRSIAEYERVLARQYPVTPPSVLSRLARAWLREREDGRFEQKLDPAFGKRMAEMTREEMEAQSKADAEWLWKALETLPCPVLIVRGAASDILSADVADRMEEVVPNATLEIVARAGHSVMMDNPAEFERVLSGFVLGS